MAAAIEKQQASEKGGFGRPSFLGKRNGVLLHFVTRQQVSSTSPFPLSHNPYPFPPAALFTKRYKILSNEAPIALVFINEFPAPPGERMIPEK